MLFYHQNHFTLALTNGLVGITIPLRLHQQTFWLALNPFTFASTNGSASITICLRLHQQTFWLALNLFTSASTNGSASIKIPVRLRQQAIWLASKSFYVCINKRFGLHRNSYAYFNYWRIPLCTAISSYFYKYFNSFFEFLYVFHFFLITYVDFNSYLHFLMYFNSF